MRRLLLLVAITVVGVFTSHVSSANALSSDSKQFISADNTFYAYVKGGETISGDFVHVDSSDESSDRARGDVTITLDGPGAQQQRCVAPANVAIGQGCHFAPQTATKSGIWRLQFTAPPGAKPYSEAAPIAHWGGNWFTWNIVVKSGADEQHGRIWTEQYNLRQPAAASYIDDLVNYYISEDGYIYKASELGYNGQISTLSADAIGIRSGTECISAYQSINVSSTDLSPSFGACGNNYKMFFEQPAGDLPAGASTWDGKTDWIQPNVSRPSISELHFDSNKSPDQQSGTISFFLHNFIGQYQIKIDTDGDGNFDGQNDVVLNEQMKSLSAGLQQVHFDGVNKTGQIIPPSQHIGIQVNITRVAEIHLVAADVEGRTGGVELTRMNGDNAPTTRLCWNDTQLLPISDTDPSNTTPIVDGSNCPDSTGGVHSWAYDNSSWGNARYIDDWVYASAKLDGSNQIVYPQDTVASANVMKKNWLFVIFVIALLIIGGGGAIAIIRRRKKQQSPQTVPQMPQPPVHTQPSDTHPNTYDGKPPTE